MTKKEKRKEGKGKGKGENTAPHNASGGRKEKGGDLNFELLRRKDRVLREKR